MLNNKRKCYWSIRLLNNTNVNGQTCIFYHEHTCSTTNMLQYLIFEHKNTLMREQHLINTSVCLSGILLTRVFTNQHRCFYFYTYVLLTYQNFYKHYNVLNTVYKKNTSVNILTTMFIFSHSCYWHIKLLQMLYFKHFNMCTTVVLNTLITLIIFVFIIGRIGQRCLFCCCFAQLTVFCTPTDIYLVKKLQFFEILLKQKRVPGPQVKRMGKSFTT